MAEPDPRPTAVRPRPVDVVVVGYGPVGATAANLLGQAGLRVVVVERDPAPYARARAVSTDEDVLRCWQHAGLAEELKADMLGGRDVDFVDAAGRSFLDLRPTPKGNGHPVQMLLHQPALEATLRRGVGRFADVEVLLEHEAGTPRQDADGVELDVTDLRAGTRTTIRAAYLLACDGGSSPIRSGLGIGFEGRTAEDAWLVVDAKVLRPWPGADRLRFHCDPRRPAVDCPVPLGHHRWEFPVPPGEDREGIASEASVWRLLARRGITDAHVELLRRVVYVHHVRFAQRWREGRVFLLGDAAHCMPPYIGQGMGSGVRDAANLCWKLAAVVRGEAAPALLASYAAERQPHVRELTRAAVAVGRLITERRPRLAALRNRVLRAAMRTPRLGAFIRDAEWMALPEHRRTGFADRAARGAMVGERLRPQPFVVDHEGRRTRLDDVLGERWNVLVLPAAAARTAAARERWAALGAGTLVLVDRPATAPGELRDEGGTLLARLAAGRTDALVVRPDAYVWTAARSGEPLAGPPPVLLAGRSAVPAA